MKKYFKFILVIIILILIYIFLTSSSRNYSINYNINGFDITEEYNKISKVYKYTVHYNDKDYEFNEYKKYSKNRKLVKEVNLDNNCISINTDRYFNPICFNDNYYINNNKNYNQLIEKKDNYDIYNNNLTYYVWDGYGIRNVLNNKEYHFLNNEHYDNNLSYTFNNYIVFADYNSSKTFNKLYVFDNTKNKLFNIKLNKDISFDSYFMGHFNDSIYIFDKENVVEYEINLKKKKMKKISNRDAAYVYDKNFYDIPINNAKYNNIKFKYNYLYNYKMIDNKLYFNIMNSNIDVLITEDIDDILFINSDYVYYVYKDSLYRYSYNDGLELLLKNFEWNFSYMNKIFVF